MRNGLLQPEPRKKPRGEETTRAFWKPKPTHRPKAKDPVPYLLAPDPWPRGQFRVDPEA